MLRKLLIQEARVYASSASTPWGDLLIMGGIGDGDSILDTVEIVYRQDEVVDEKTGRTERFWRSETQTARYFV